MERIGSGGNDTFDEWLKICWRKQECGSCLGTRGVVCSWCPASGTCIPNPSHPALFAPFSNPDICPLWSERWELRTSALGCHVSTITFLTCIVSVLASFAVMGVAVGAFFFGRWMRGVWARRGTARGEEWWRFWRGWKLELVDVVRRRRSREEEIEEEQRPLLDAE
ncbi:hypothetical protein BKA61DRAFT_490453 [Leptodontidium sp. MPI-SDFR-AT-0119]|nr:hypothetical protein BKA61DRAFT_490453 [Leptodontidium sp. MPI-SDFR-AT-0119]